ncbi:MAG: polynucleotide adenylyltransferase PcnB [Gammaproteobacteria bacterium]
MASSATGAETQHRIIPRPDHNVSRAQISNNALKVLYRLRDAGYQAFLVGGGVRDLLLGREPKDFDIATDALPDDVRRLFRNCRLIGRRFRLAHVYFGRDIVEVATFRASEDDLAVDEEALLLLDEAGRILRDNRYGTIDDDVWRRDFTANSLYYNIADFSIWDYCGGVDDIRAGVLRLIGEPEARYREDPVRLLRAVRFAAKLGFRIEAGTEAPLRPLAATLEAVPPARLFDEVLKLFLGGSAVPSYELLRRYGLFAHLFPAVDALLDSAAGEPYRALLLEALRNTDERVADDQPVTPVFLFAVLLWGPVRRRAAKLEERGESPVQALLLAADDACDDQQRHVAIPRRITTPMKEMMVMQLRLQKTRGRRVLNLLGHARFRAAYDFLCLRALVGDADPALAKFWTDLQALDEDGRVAAVDPGGRRAGSRPATVEEGSGTPDDSQAAGAEPAAKPRRRRRPRRRKPGGGTGAS